MSTTDPCLDASQSHPKPLGSKRPGDEFSDQSKQKIECTYAASGVKHALHGTIYQLQLLMLFVLRGKKFFHEFCLATEMDSAEKFDDVVFKYKESAGAEKFDWDFLQVKHKQDPEKNKITINDLITEADGDFSLQKYFISFYKIKKKADFQGGNLKNFTLCTNTGFNFPTKPANVKRKLNNDLKDKWKGFLSEEKDLQNDKILGLNVDKEEDGQLGKEVRFKVHDELITAIAEKIITSLLVRPKGAKEIVNLNLAKDKFKAQNIFKLSGLIEEINNEFNQTEMEYKTKIKSEKELLGVAKKVLNIEDRIFKDLDQRDSENAINKAKKRKPAKDKPELREVLEKAREILKEANIAKNNAKDKIDKYKDPNSEEAKALQKEKDELKSIERNLKDTMDTISRSETTLEDLKIEIEKDFLKKWIPSSTLDKIKKKMTSDLEEAREILKKSLEKIVIEISVEGILHDEELKSTIREFLEKFRFVVNYPNVDKLNSFIGKEVGEDLNLLNADLATYTFQKDMLDWFKEKGGTFILKEKSNQIFKSFITKINVLMTSGLGKAYPEKLNAYKICFKMNLQPLQDFLSSNERQVLHVSTEATRLSAIKVLENLKGCDKFKNHDSCIFMRLKTLLFLAIQNLAMDAFSSETSHYIMVIECQPKNQEKKEITQLYNILYNILSNNSSKKLVLIAHVNDVLASKFPDRDKIEDQTLFKDLHPDSQKMILEREINIQGKYLPLNEFINENSAGEIIDQTILSNLIDGKRILIGGERDIFPIGCTLDYYINRKLHRQRVKKEVLNFKEVEGLPILFVTGANEEMLTELGAEKKYLHKWENGKTYDRGIIWFFDQSDQSEKVKISQIFKDFQNELLVWLEYQNGLLIWRACKGNSLALQRYIDKDFVPDEKNSIKEESFRKLGEKVIIIANDAGMGKSTLLTSIAREMNRLNDNKKFDNLWTVRLNLNDFAFNKEKLRDHDERKNLQSLKEISFESDNTDAAINFVSKMAFIGGPGDSYIKFHQELFKKSLPKISILFDGFDEISPTYKEKVFILLKTLKKSEVNQIWVTTRIHEKAYLENELESPAYVLNDLTKGDQKEFLNKFWRCSLIEKIQKIQEKISDSQETKPYLEQLKREFDAMSESLSITLFKNLRNIISETLQEQEIKKEETIDKLKSLTKVINKMDEHENYELNFTNNAEALLKLWKSSINAKEKAFTNVPLNLRMLAEIVFENKFQISKNMRLLDIYDEFIKIKLDIYKEEKAKAIQGNTTADVVYSVYYEKLRKIHRELALELFFKDDELSFDRNKMRKFEELLRKSENDARTEIQRAGLMSYLSDGSPRFIHISFAEYFLSEFLIVYSQKEQVQLLLLEVLLKKEFILIRKFFNAQLEKNSELYIEFTDAVKKTVDKAPQNTVLHLIIKEGHTAIVKFLLQGFSECKESLKNIILKTDEEDDYNALLLAIDNDCNEIVLTLCKFMKDNYEEIITEMFKPNKRRRYALSMCFFGRNTDNLEACLSVLKDIPDKETFPRLRTNENKEKILELLLNWFAKNLEETPIEEHWDKVHKFEMACLYYIDESEEFEKKIEDLRYSALLRNSYLDAKKK